MTTDALAPVGPPPSAYEQILYEVDDPVATITLDRPERRNAWTTRMATEVRHALARAEADPAVVVIVLTGAGKGFCSGGDVDDLDPPKSLDPSGLGADWGLDVDPGDPDVDPSLRGVYTFPMSIRKPVIAAVNGACAGMAMAIVLGCDLRFASSSAIFTTRYAPMGLIAEFGTSWLLSRLVGQAHAMDLLLSSRVVDGAEAERIGLVNKTFPEDEFMAKVMEYARTMGASCAPNSLAKMKRQVYADMENRFGEATDTSFALMQECFAGPDLREGVKSFQEKRPPVFERIGASAS